MLDAFNFFEHFEHAFWRVCEQALEGLAQTFTLERVATCTFFFRSHNFLQQGTEYINLKLSPHTPWGINVTI